MNAIFRLGLQADHCCDIREQQTGCIKRYRLPPRARLTTPHTPEPRGTSPLQLSCHMSVAAAGDAIHVQNQQRRIQYNTIRTCGFYMLSWLLAPAGATLTDRTDARCRAAVHCPLAEGPCPQANGAPVRRRRQPGAAARVPAWPAWPPRPPGLGPRPARTGLHTAQGTDGCARSVSFRQISGDIVI